MKMSEHEKWKAYMDVYYRALFNEIYDLTPKFGFAAMAEKKRQKEEQCEPQRS